MAHNPEINFPKRLSTLQQIVNNRREFPILVKTRNRLLSFQKMPIEEEGKIIFIESEMALTYARIKVLKFPDENKVTSEHGADFCQLHSSFEGEEFYMPLGCPGKLRIIPYPGTRRRYVNVSSIMQENPRYLQAVDDIMAVPPRHTTDHCLTIIPAGTIIEPKSVVHHNKVRYLKCVNREGSCFYLREDCRANFTNISNMKEYSLQQIQDAGIMLPTPIQFVPGTISPYDVVLFHDDMARNNLVITNGPLEVLEIVTIKTLIAKARESERGCFKTLLLPQTIYKTFHVQEAEFRTFELKSRFVERKFGGCQGDNDFICCKMYLIPAAGDLVSWLQNPRLLTKDVHFCESSDSDSDYEIPDIQPVPKAEMPPPLPGIMASVDIDYLLTNAAKVNWLKGALAMDITDEAIRPFVEKAIKTFHTDIKSNFRPGSLCGKCKSTNAKHCHSGKCSDITSHIESTHRFKGPCYKNSDITKWLSDPWEIAKCYMSRSKDLEGQPGSDIDCPSLLNIVINNTRFETLITKADLTNENNVFCQGRNARNKTMHSKGHQMTDTDLKDYCDIFIEIVNIIGAFSKRNVKKIEKVRDTPLSITAEEIVKLKEQAARYPEFTEDVIDNMKTAMWEEAEKMIKHIKDEAEKVIGTSLVANFIEGCKESLYRLTVERFQRQRPNDIEEDEWTISKFVDCLRIFPDTNNLSPRHNAILFRKTHIKEDIRKWDLFLLCCILQIELRVPVASNVRLYVNNVKQIRDELLHNSVEQIDLSKLCDYLDDPLKSDTLRIYSKKYTVSDTLHANNDLVSWHTEEDAFSINDRYRRADIETDKAAKKMIDMEQRILAMEQQLQRDSGSGVNTKSREVNVNVVPQNVSQEENDLLNKVMTSPETNNAICEQIDFTEDFERKTGCKPNGIVKGSIILKVECRSVESMVGFWKGCTDGTVVKAMSTIRDAYRRHLGNDKLEFDIVLKRCEVIRCRNNILEDLNLRLEQIKEQLTDVDNLISPPDFESGTDFQKEQLIENNKDEKIPIQNQEKLREMHTTILLPIVQIQDRDVLQKVKDKTKLGFGKVHDELKRIMKTTKVKKKRSMSNSSYQAIKESKDRSVKPIKTNPKQAHKELEHSKSTEETNTTYQTYENRSKYGHVKRAPLPSLPRGASLTAIDSSDDEDHAYSYMNMTLEQLPRSPSNKERKTITARVEPISISTKYETNSKTSPVQRKSEASKLDLDNRQLSTASKTETSFPKSPTNDSVDATSETFKHYDDCLGRIEDNSINLNEPPSRLTNMDFFTYSIEETTACLKYCGLEKIANICNEQKLDGEFFKHTDVAAIKDSLNLSALDILKLRKMYNGWRPKYN